MVVTRDRLKVKNIFSLIRTLCCLSLNERFLVKIRRLHNEQTRKKKTVNKMSKNVSHTISVSQPIIFYQLLLPPETGYFHLKVYC